MQRTSHKTLFKHYQEHENEPVTNAEVMEMFGIKCALTIWLKKRKIREDETIKDRANLITFNFPYVIPNQGARWTGGTMFINPATATEETADLLQRAADYIFKKHTNLIRLIEQIGKSKIKVFLLKNQRREAKRISERNTG